MIGACGQYTACSHEHHYRYAIGRTAQNDFESVHLMNVGHAKGSEHGQDDESHSSAKVAAVDRNQELEETSRDKSLEAGVMSAEVAVYRGRRGSCQLSAENKQQGGGEHKPGQNP